MNDSVVAILGWIIPDPFAKPVIVTFLSPNGSTTVTVFFTVSVVNIALAASRAES